MCDVNPTRIVQLRMSIRCHSHQTEAPSQIPHDQNIRLDAKEKCISRITGNEAN